MTPFCKGPRVHRWSLWDSGHEKKAIYKKGKKGIIFGVCQKSPGRLPKHVEEGLMIKNGTLGHQGKHCVLQHLSPPRENHPHCEA